MSMGTIDDFLGIDAGDPTEQIRIVQADNAYGLIERLRDVRRADGLSQTEVARRMGRHQSVVSNIERLGSDPRWSSIRNYASALGVVIGYDVHEQHQGDDVLRYVADVDSDPDLDPETIGVKMREVVGR